MTHPPNAVGSPTPEKHSSVNRAKKILVVDDDDATREVLRWILEQASFEVNEASDNDEALKKIQSCEPDLLTSDIGRPGGSGLELLRLVKDRRPSLPVVFVTGQSSYREACMAEGAAAFINKPFEPEQLVEVVSNALSNRGKKILVVEDDDDTRELLRLVLERASFKVNEAANNHQALEKIQSWEPDLVTTDIGRLPPDGSGLELLRLIKHRRPSLPVVVVTAGGGALSWCRETCMAEGAADFIEKGSPASKPEQFVEAVSKVLSMTKAGEQG